MRFCYVEYFQAFLGSQLETSIEGSKCTFPSCMQCCHTLPEGFFYFLLVILQRIHCVCDCLIARLCL